MSHSTPILLLLVLLTVRLSDAHSFLTDPEPYNRVFKTKSCRGSECRQACPNILNRGMANSINNPEKVWRRGQQVNIKWAKNNHRGGLMRMSIVPVNRMMDREAHKKFGIYYGCWEQGEYRCSGKLCGSDTDNEGFQRDIVIPTVIPDGKYIFGLVWYGGLHFSRDKGHFPDYFSCAYIEIRGGPLGGSYQPFFQDGDTGKFRRKDGKCDTASDEPGRCPVSGCKGRAFPAVSKPFQNGRKPDRLVPSDYGGKNAPLPGRAPVAAPQPRPTSSEDRSGNTGDDDDDDDDDERDDGDDESSPRTSGNGGGMVCKGSVCCPGRCGECGGSGCSKRPGGGQNCCFSKIKQSGRVCGRDPPPCSRN